jgi:hypothetical protein
VGSHAAQQGSGAVRSQATLRHQQRGG